MKPFFVLEIVSHQPLTCDIEVLTIAHGYDFTGRDLLTVLRGPECSCGWCKDLRRTVAERSESFYGNIDESKEDHSLHAEDVSSRVTVEAEFSGDYYSTRDES